MCPLCNLFSISYLLYFEWEWDIVNMYSMQNINLLWISISPKIRKMWKLSIPISILPIIKKFSNVKLWSNPWIFRWKCFIFKIPTCISIEIWDKRRTYRDVRLVAELYGKRGVKWSCISRYLQSNWFYKLQNALENAQRSVCSPW